MTVTPSGSRRWFPAKAVLSVAASVVAVPLLLFLIEQAASIVVARTDSDRMRWIDEDRRIRENNLLKSFAQWTFPFDAPPLWRSRGLRVPLRPSPLRHRIVVLGDSFVWGDGHANINDVWWRQLARELRRRGYDVDVVALGLNGFSTRQELDALRQFVSYGKPDLVVWGFVTNDPDEGVVKYQSANRPRFWPVSGALSRTYPLIVRALTSNRYPRWEQALLQEPNLGRYATTVSDVARFLRDQRIAAMFVTLPVSPQLPPVDARVSNLFRRAGADWVETRDLFVRDRQFLEKPADFRSWAVNPVNGHPGPRAMHIYAVAAANEIEVKFRPVLGQARPAVVAPPLVNDWMPSTLAVQRTHTGVAFVWPGSRLMPRVPLWQPHVQLSLAEPVPLREIVASGPSLDRIHLYATIENDEHYDDGHLVDAGEKRGAHPVWRAEELRGLRISTLRLVASFRGSDRSLRLDLIGDEP